MADESTVNLGHGLPETILPDVPEAWAGELAVALDVSGAAALTAVRCVAGEHPRYLAAWAALAALATDPVESYAYARVGYHRGLDALRAAGWRGSGYVRWRHSSNRGFLECLEALRKAAGEIGESDEEERCALFLHQLDPTGGPD